MHHPATVTYGAAPWLIALHVAVNYVAHRSTTSVLRTPDVSPRWVPPQNSMEYWQLSSAPGSASKSSTGLPMDTTRTGSGYTWKRH